MLAVALIILGGLLYRQRGGGIDLPIGTQGARLVWCIPTGVLCAMLFGNWWLLPAVATAAFLGLMIPHGRFQDVGTCGDSVLHDVVGMSCVCNIRGVLIYLPVILIAHQSPILVLLLPLLAGPAYWLAWRIPSTIPHLERGCALGEFFTGCLFWAGITLPAEIFV